MGFGIIKVAAHVIPDHHQFIRIVTVLDNTVKRRFGIGTAASGGAGEELRQNAALGGTGRRDRQYPGQNDAGYEGQ
jgi:hypothetical protein